MSTIELLNRFCASQHDVREYLRAPFRLGEHVYATNGYMAVRVRDDSFVAVEAHEKAKRIAEYFDEALFAAMATSSPIAIPTLPAPITCDNCSGKGFVYEIECADCDSNGWFLHGDHEYDCKECEGRGHIRVDPEDYPEKKSDCWHCEGTGNIRHQSVPVGNAFFARRFLALLADLPGAHFTSVNGDKTASFIFDGGEGILMPIRK